MAANMAGEALIKVVEQQETLDQLSAKARSRFARSTDDVSHGLHGFHNGSNQIISSSVYEIRVNPWLKTRLKVFPPQIYGEKLRCDVF